RTGTPRLEPAGRPKRSNPQERQRRDPDRLELPRSFAEAWALARAQQGTRDDDPTRGAHRDEGGRRNPGPGCRPHADDHDDELEDQAEPGGPTTAESRRGRAPEIGRGSCRGGT